MGSLKESPSKGVKGINESTITKEHDSKNSEIKEIKEAGAERKESCSDGPSDRRRYAEDCSADWANAYFDGKGWSKGWDDEYCDGKGPRNTYYASNRCGTEDYYVKDNAAEWDYWKGGDGKGYGKDGDDYYSKNGCELYGNSHSKDGKSYNEYEKSYNTSDGKSYSKGDGDYGKSYSKDNDPYKYGKSYSKGDGGYGKSYSKDDDSYNYGKSYSKDDNSYNYGKSYNKDDGDYGKSYSKDDAPHIYGKSYSKGDGDYGKSYSKDNDPYNYGKSYSKGDGDYGKSYSKDDAPYNYGKSYSKGDGDYGKSYSKDDDSYNYGKSYSKGDGESYNYGKNYIKGNADYYGKSHSKGDGKGYDYRKGEKKECGYGNGDACEKGRGKESVLKDRPEDHNSGNGKGSGVSEESTKPTPNKETPRALPERRWSPNKGADKGRFSGKGPCGGRGVSANRVPGKGDVVGKGGWFDKSSGKEATSKGKMAEMLSSFLYWYGDCQDHECSGWNRLLSSITNGKKGKKGRGKDQKNPIVPQASPNTNQPSNNLQQNSTEKQRVPDQAFTEESGWNLYEGEYDHVLERRGNQMVVKEECKEYTEALNLHSYYDVKVQCKLCRNAKKKWNHFTLEHEQEEKHQRALREREDTKKTIEEIIRRRDADPDPNYVFTRDPMKNRPYVMIVRAQEMVHKHVMAPFLRCVLCGENHDEEVTAPVLKQNRFSHWEHLGEAKHQKKAWAFEEDVNTIEARDARRQVLEMKKALILKDPSFYQKVGGNQDHCLEIPSSSDSSDSEIECQSPSDKRGAGKRDSRASSELSDLYIPNTDDPKYVEARRRLYGNKLQKNPVERDGNPSEQPLSPAVEGSGGRQPVKDSGVCQPGSDTCKADVAGQVLAQASTKRPFNYCESVITDDLPMGADYSTFASDPGFGQSGQHGYGITHSPGLVYASHSAFPQTNKSGLPPTSMSRSHPLQTSNAEWAQSATGLQTNCPGGSKPLFKNAFPQVYAEESPAQRPEKSPCIMENMVRGLPELNVSIVEDMMPEISDQRRIDHMKKNRTAMEQPQMSELVPESQHPVIDKLEVGAGNQHPIMQKSKAAEGVEHSVDENPSTFVENRRHSVIGRPRVVTEMPEEITRRTVTILDKQNAVPESLTSDEKDQKTCHYNKDKSGKDGPGKDKIDVDDDKAPLNPDCDKGVGSDLKTKGVDSWKGNLKGNSGTDDMCKFKGRGKNDMYDFKGKGKNDVCDFKEKGKNDMDDFKGKSGKDLKGKPDCDWQKGKPDWYYHWKETYGELQEKSKNSEWDWKGKGKCDPDESKGKGKPDPSGSEGGGQPGSDGSQGAGKAGPDDSEGKGRPVPDDSERRGKTGPGDSRGAAEASPDDSEGRGGPDPDGSEGKGRPDPNEPRGARKADLTDSEAERKPDSDGSKAAGKVGPDFSKGKGKFNSDAPKGKSNDDEGVCKGKGKFDGWWFAKENWFGTDKGDMKGKGKFDGEWLSKESWFGKDKGDMKGKGKFDGEWLSKGSWFGKDKGDMKGKGKFDCWWPSQESWFGKDRGDLKGKGKDEVTGGWSADMKGKGKDDMKGKGKSFPGKSQGELDVEQPSSKHATIQPLCNEVQRIPTASGAVSPRNHVESKTENSLSTAASEASKENAVSTVASSGIAVGVAEAQAASKASIEPQTTPKTNIQPQHNAASKENINNQHSI